MTPLPPTTTDQELIAFIDDWVRLLEAERYEEAFQWTNHRGDVGWSPELIREIITAYVNNLPGQKVTLERTVIDIQQRKEVTRFAETSDGQIGYIWYDLNINSVTSDLTATFDIIETELGFILELDEIHVM